MILLFTGCDLSVDLTFVLDVSISIGGDEYFNMIKDLAKQISAFPDIGMDKTLVGVILFARDALIEFDLQKYPMKADLINAIDEIVYSNIPRYNRTGTNIPAALKLLGSAGQSNGALKLRNDPDIPKIVVLVTDGRTNTRVKTGNTKEQDRLETINAAKVLHSLKIYDHIYAVGIRGKKDIIFDELMNDIATDPSQAIIIDEFNATVLSEVERNLTDMVCNRKFTCNALCVFM